MKIVRKSATTRASSGERKHEERKTLRTDCGPILIVDDEANFRAFAALLFARAGFETIEAGTGGEALAAARAERPALVLLDVSMPDINGFEVCCELRDEFGDTLPIIFVSGDRTGSVDRSVGLLVGGDDYLVKPFDPDELLARARRAIGRSIGEQSILKVTSDGFGLTQRETEVLQRLVAGEQSAEIATGLFISPKTVRSHVQRILTKLGAHSRAQAVAIAYQNGLVSDAADKLPSAAA